MFAAEGGVTSASDEIVTNPASANELCFLQIHGALCMTEDEALSDCEWVLKSQKAYISWCWWLHKSFCWHWHSRFAVLWPQDRKWHSPWWPCFSSVNDFAISFVEQTQVLVTTTSFLFRCFSCTCFSLINYSTRGVRRREKHCSCSSIEGHQWLHRSRTAQACTHLCKGSIGRARCEYTTRTLLLFAGVEQKPHVQTKLDNLLVLQSLFLWVSQTIMPAFSSLRFSCLHFLLSGFHACIFLSRGFITGATVNLAQDDVALSSVVTTECYRTLEKTTRRRVNCLPWLDSLLLRQTEHSSRFFFFLLGRICSLFNKSVKSFVHYRCSWCFSYTYCYSKLYSTQKADRQEHIVMVYAHILRTWHSRIYFVFCEHGVWWDRICFYWWGTSCAYRVLWMCWQGTLLSKGTCRNFDEDTSDLVIDDEEITIFRTSSSVFSEAHSALNILFHCKPPVITACYSMIISMFMSRQKRDC